MHLRPSLAIPAATFVAFLTLAGCATSPGSTSTGEPSGGQPPASAASTDAQASADAGERASEPTSDTMAADADPRLNFTTTTVAGETFDGTSLAGTDAILWFWAAWCPTCQAEAPSIARAVTQLPEGVTLYGVPGKSDQAGMEQFVSAYGLDGMTHLIDPDGSLWTAFGVPYQPAFAFIDDAGEITTVQGALGEEELLERARELAASER